MFLLPSLSSMNWSPPPAEGSSRLGADTEKSWWRPGAQWQVVSRQLRIWPGEAARQCEPRFQAPIIPLNLSYTNRDKSKSKGKMIKNSSNWQLENIRIQGLTLSEHGVYCQMHWLLIHELAVLLCTRRRPKKATVQMAGLCTHSIQ